MFPSPISNHSSSLSQQLRDLGCLNAVVSTPISPRQPHLPQTQITQKIKKKRSLPGNPDPEAEVIALSPKTLLATNRFVCEICNKGFQRDQNLQLHRRGHNLPWKLKQRSGNEARKRAYVCPEASCVHHHPSRALGDLTGIKKHYCRKHGEKKWKCDRCSKIYAVQSDWKAHSKTCGTREYRCDCGTLFSRKDSFITHRAFCDALAEESARISASAAAYPIHHRYTSPKTNPVPSPLFPFSSADPNPNPNLTPLHVKPETSFHFSTPLVPFQVPKPVTPSPFQALHVGTQLSAAPHMSATALLQKAATIGSTATQLNNVAQLGRAAVDSPELMGSLAAWQKNDRLTRDFLGLAGDVSGSCNGGGGVSVNVSINVGEMLTYAGGIELQQYEREREALVKPQQQQQQGFALAGPAPETWRNYS